MDKGKTVLIILVSALVAVTIFLAFRNSVLASQVAAGTALNKELIALYKNIDQKCLATDQEPEKLTKCLKDLNKKYQGAYVEESGFANVDKTGNPGYIIVKNKAMTPLNSTDFTLVHNLEMASRGCDINGALAKDYTCKLAFATPCEKGDVLEVQYKGSRAWLKNC